VFGDQSFVFHLDSGQVVPNIWHFLYKLNITSTNLIIIKLKPKFFYYIVLIVRILFISSICSQVQVFIICLLESKALFAEFSLQRISICLVDIEDDFIM